jgi:hypothetical protein
MVLLQFVSDQLGR